MPVKQSTKEIVSKVGAHLRTRLLSGILVLVPLAITLFILRVCFEFITGFGLPLVRPWFGEISEHGLTQYVVTLIAAALMLVLIYATGVITAHIVGRRLIRLGESLLLKLPVVKSIYSATRQVVDTFSAASLGSSRAVVFVEFPRPGALAPAFVTGITVDPDGKPLYRVFVPAAVNPTSGFLLFLPQEQLQFTDISVEDGVKMLVSGGTIAPKQYARVATPVLPSEPPPKA